MAKSAWVVLLLFLCSLGVSSQGLAQEGLWQSYIKDGEAALRVQDYATAEDKFLAAVRAAESFPPKDPRLGKTLNNLAAVYYVQGDYARAMPLLARAAEEIERVLGPDDPDVAQALKNLAAVHYLQKNYAAAEPLLLRALAIWEKAVGPDHPYVATVLSNLAGLYQAEGRYADAEPLLLRSLAIWEKLLGPDHPDVAASRKLLAELREAQGRAPASAAADDDAASPEPELAFAPAEEPGSTATQAAGQVEPDGATSSVQPLVQEPPAESAPATSKGSGTVKGRLALAPGGNKGSPSAPGKASSNGAAHGIAVYLSSFRSSEDAEHHWETLRNGFPSIFGGKELTVEEVNTSGRGTFYRVLASPFESLATADGVCREMKQQRQFCQVVRQ